MPTYKLRNKDNDVIWEEFMGISACETFLKENPHIERLFNGAPMVIGGTGDRFKTDDGFNDLLGRVARANPTSKLADQYGDKGIKAVKIREAVKKKQKKYGITATT